MDTTDQNSAAAPAVVDALADVAQTHTVTEAERAALAAEQAAPAEAPPAVAPTAAAVAAEPAAAAMAAAAEPPAQVATPEPSAVAAAAAPGPQLLQVPVAPKDFDAAFAELDRRAESGELDDAQFRKELRALTLEQSRFESARTTIETHNAAAIAQAQAQAADSFAVASDAFVKQNQEFMANPLRAQSLQQAINLIDEQTKGALAPAELLARASKIAFEAYGWAPAAAAAAAPQRPAVATATAAALAARQPATAAVPATLGDVPTSGTDSQAGRFAHLANASIQDMETAIAKMSPAEQEAFLLEVDSPIE